MKEAVRNVARNVASYTLNECRRFGAWIDAYEGRLWEVIGAIYLGMSYVWPTEAGTGALFGAMLVFCGMLHVKIEMVEERLYDFTNTSKNIEGESHE